MYKYILFNKSAVERLINEPEFQSIEFPLGENLINIINGEHNIQYDLMEKNIILLPTSNGILVSGEKFDKNYLLFDLCQCELMIGTTNEERLIVLQKTFRFAVRYWNKQAFTSCEKIYNNKAVIFPFSYSNNAPYRIVIERDPKEKRLEKRGTFDCLLAYKYNKLGLSANVAEHPDHTIYLEAGQEYIDHRSQITLMLEERSKQEPDIKDDSPIKFVETDCFHQSNEFRYLSVEKQLTKLTKSQNRIVDCNDFNSPIRIQGPAGTGKTAAMVLRCIKMLDIYNREGKELSISFFTHSKSTEKNVRELILRGMNEKYLSNLSKQQIHIFTLQEYCVKFIELEKIQIIDIDASEAKQYQLLLIQDAFKKKCKAYNTMKPLMSPQAARFYDEEELNKIILMLQFEFSIRIKGMAEGDCQKYKKLSKANNGLPINNDADIDYVLSIYNEYQQSLALQSVYDTDDIVLEASARLNGPLWRRRRRAQGADYIFVDEMHLFNLNEQQIFHLLTKNVDQEKVPICFALDYAQFIGDRGINSYEYIESTLGKALSLRQELKTIFRSSQKIFELCASITASGALLFSSFINPYEYCESSFIKDEEDKCEKPIVYMYQNDILMQKSIEGHVTYFKNKYKCMLDEIAVIFFDINLIEKYKESIGDYPVKFIDGTQEKMGEGKPAVVVSMPDFVNGLEFKCVILVGVDEGRVPNTSMHDISSNFMRYSALNKLYIVCSRAQYAIRILGTEVQGMSSCLNYSISNKTLDKKILE